MNRTALSLLELLVAIAILAVLIALLVPAIQKVREVALRIKSQNNVKQVGSAVLIYADLHGGRMPAVDRDFAAPQPNVHQAAVTVLNSVNVGPGFDGIYPWNPVFLSPADPSAVACLSERDESGNVAGRPTSYSANAQVFARAARYQESVADGTSNTLFFAERYADCFLGTTNYHAEGVGFAWNRADLAAYGIPNNVYPVPVPGQLSHPSRPGATFQVRPLWVPRPDDVQQLVNLVRFPPAGICDPTVPQTPHAGGMIVGVGDGSVRTVGSGVQPDIFWSLVTPNGGEVANDW
jgi:hypothetical protein